MTLAQELAELKSAKPKSTIITTTPTLTTTPTTITAVRIRPRAKRIVIHEQEQAPTPTVSSQQPSQVKVDEELAFKLQDKEEEEEEEEETKRAEEKRNIPPTRAQQGSIMYTYLKNMEEWKPKSLKNKSFSNIQELFDKTMKKVNTFVDFRTELVEEREELEQESSKKQKLEEDKESTELKQCLEIISDDGDDVTIDATPLSTKSPTIVDYKDYAND
ncbi:hypothetical protein Tco_1046149, partial [Tanacetum coccineum]